MVSVKQLLMISSVLSLLTIILLPSVGVYATATGTIECPTSTFGGASFSANLVSLTPSTAYAFFRGTTSLINFTTSVTETSRVVYFEVVCDAGYSDRMTLKLYASNTLIDTKVVSVNSIEDFFGLNFLINLGIIMLIMSMIVGIIVAVKRGFR